MGWFQLIGIVLKFAMRLFDLRKESDEKLAAKKANALKGQVDAFAITDPKKRDSAVVSAIDNINRLR